MDTAILALVDHNLLHRIGSGPSAVYFVPSAAYHMAFDMAYADFQTKEVSDENRSIPSEMHHGHDQENAKYKHNHQQLGLQGSYSTSTLKMSSRERVVSPCALGPFRRAVSPRAAGGIRSPHVLMNFGRGERRGTSCLKRHSAPSSAVEDVHGIPFPKRLRVPRNINSKLDLNVKDRNNEDPKEIFAEKLPSRASSAGNVDEHVPCQPMSP